MVHKEWNSFNQYRDVQLDTLQPMIEESSCWSQTCSCQEVSSSPNNHEKEVRQGRQRECMRESELNFLGVRE